MQTVYIARYQQKRNDFYIVSLDRNPEKEEYNMIFTNNIDNAKKFESLTSAMAYFKRGRIKFAGIDFLKL